MLLASMDTLSLVASIAFLVGGVAMVVGALRNSLLQSKLHAQDKLRRKDAVAEFWRTMDAAADRLEQVIIEIQEKSENRRNVLEKLSVEAHQLIRRMEKLLESVDAEAVKRRREERAKLASVTSARSARPKPEPDSPFERSAYRHVVEAGKSGRSLEEICRDADMPKGEVELILTLSSRMDQVKQAVGATAEAGQAQASAESSSKAQATPSPSAKRATDEEHEGH